LAVARARLNHSGAPATGGRFPAWEESCLCLVIMARVSAKEFPFFGDRIHASKTHYFEPALAINASLPFFRISNRLR
jgi:hypothetical protein